MTTEATSRPANILSFGLLEPSTVGIILSLFLQKLDMIPGLLYTRPSLLQSSVGRFFKLLSLSDLLTSRHDRRVVVREAVAVTEEATATGAASNRVRVGATAGVEGFVRAVG